MFSTPGLSSFDRESEDGSRREAVTPIWPVGPRVVLAATVIAAALGLAVGSRGVDPPPVDGIVAAPKLKLDPNTAPPQVLGTLPQVGPTLVRQLVLARQDGPFTSLEDIRSRVRGVGPATLEQLAPYLRFESATAFRPDQLASSHGDRPGKKPRARVRKKPRSPTPAPARAQTQLVAQTAEPGAP
ncbi:MAG: ComEA family DNA-binding protein [Isosphaerales bacterium]